MRVVKCLKVFGLAFIVVSVLIIFEKTPTWNIISVQENDTPDDSGSSDILLSRLNSVYFPEITSSQTTTSTRGNVFLSSRSYLTSHGKERSAIDNSTYHYLQRDRRREFPSIDLSKQDGKFKKSHFMTVLGHGSRLGNQIFQFAALLGVSALHGYTPYISPSSRLPDFLETFDVNVTYKSHITNVKQFATGSPVSIYLKDIETLDHTRNWTLKGCFQSWRYFGHINDLIRKTFKIKSNILQKAREILEEINVFNKTVIGVHVRRGDFSTENYIAKGFTVGSKHYLMRAMSYYKVRYRMPIFIVASDDPEWSRKTLKGGDVHVMANNTAAVHFAVLTLANHTIITSGTYGWMGGFLAGGEVVYFKGFPRKGSRLERLFNRSDYYPPHWIGME